MRLAVIVMFFFVCQISWAGINNAIDYEGLSESQKQNFVFYIYGVGSGFEMANAVLVQDGKLPLYCAPDGLSLTPDNYKLIFEKELSKNKDIYKKENYKESGGIVFAQMVLFYGLQDTFPCKKG